jgi:NitT/TauT family transport system substrate-binding protein
MAPRISGLVFAALLLMPGAVSAQTQLRVAYYPIRDNKLALWVAQDAGFFKKNGLDVTVTAEPKSGENTIDALLSEKVEIAVNGFRDAIHPSIASGRAGVAMIASLASNPFIFIADPGIKTAQELKGKKVWTANFGRGPDVSTRVVLRYLGLDPEKDVQLVPCENCPATLFGQPVSGHSIGVSWVLEGKVSASLSSRSTLKDLQKAGQKVTLLVDFIDAGLDITAADVIVRKDWLAANRETAKSFLKALVEATAYAKKNKEFTEAIQQKYLLKEYATGVETKFEDYVLGVLPKKPYPSVKGAEIAILEKAPGHPFFQDKTASDFSDASLMVEIEKEGLFEQLYR